jgi:hypothetical protein
MTLEQLSNLSQTVASIAVVASLIYAALQFRMYVNAAREARFTQAAAVIQDFNRLIASDGDAAAIFAKGLDHFATMKSVERWRFASMMQMMVANSQLIWEFEGVSHYKHYVTEVAASMLRREGARQWWSGGRKLFPPATVAGIDRILGSVDAALGGSGDKRMRAR